MKQFIGDNTESVLKHEGDIIFQNILKLLTLRMNVLEAILDLTKENSTTL